MPFCEKSCWLIWLTIICLVCSQSNDCGNNTPGTLCVINGENAGDPIRCRNNDPCEITCSGSDSCGDDEIDATDATDVTITCTGTDACKGNTEIYCGTGDCILNCINSGTSCEDATIYNSNNRAHSFKCTGSCNSLSGNTNEYTQQPTKSPVISSTNNPSKIPSRIPSNNPTQIPTNIPTSATTNHPSTSPTNNPSLSPTNNPSLSPTNKPTTSPTHNPSTLPTHNPSISPTYYPTTIPTHKPSFSPLFAGETVPPTHNPTDNPTYNPTHNPTSDPSTRDGAEVIVTYVVTSVESDRSDLSKKQSNTNNLPIWIYVVAACSAIFCCLGVVLIVYKIRREKERKVSYEDNFRKATNNKIHKMTTDNDIWSNPIHHQVTSISSNNFEGNLATTSNILCDEISSESEENNHEQPLYTVPMNNNMAAAIMSATPMGDDSDDRTPTTVEMSDFNKAKENMYSEGAAIGAGRNDDEHEIMGDVLTPNGNLDSNVDDDIDDIDNINNDVEVIQFIDDNVMTPTADLNDNDNDIDIDNINSNLNLDNNVLTPTGMNDDIDDIDNINNDVEVIQFIDNNIMTPTADMNDNDNNVVTVEGDTIVDTDDDDVIDDHLAHEMQTPDGDSDDDDVDIDNINNNNDEMNNHDDDICIDDIMDQNHQTDGY